MRKSRVARVLVIGAAQRGPLIRSARESSSIAKWVSKLVSDIIAAFFLNHSVNNDAEYPLLPGPVQFRCDCLGTFRVRLLLVEQNPYIATMPASSGYIESAISVQIGDCDAKRRRVHLETLRGVE